MADLNEALLLIEEDIRTFKDLCGRCSDSKADIQHTHIKDFAEISLKIEKSFVRTEEDFDNFQEIFFKRAFHTLRILDENNLLKSEIEGRLDYLENLRSLVTNELREENESDEEEQEENEDFDEEMEEKDESSDEREDEQVVDKSDSENDVGIEGGK